MTEWREAVEELLYAGETVRERVDRGPTTVVVTSHRLLAFTPEGDGPNYRAVDRPNVEGVALESVGRRWLVTGGLKALVGGILALVAGAVVDLEGVLGTLSDADGGVGGGILQLLDLVATVLAMADELLLALGGLLVVVGVGALAAYWTTRRRELVVSVAGGEEVHLDGRDFGERDAETVRAALETSSRS